MHHDHRPGPDLRPRLEPRPRTVHRHHLAPHRLRPPRPPAGPRLRPARPPRRPPARAGSGLVHRFLDPDRADLPGRPRAGGLPHALLATPLNLVTAFITLYGWAIVPLNIGWPLRAGDDYSDAWGGPTFAGAWAFHAVVGGIGFLLLMPWVVRGLTAVQFRVARSLLS